MDNRIVLGVISVFVVLAVIGSALTPMIDAYTTTTTTIDNEGAVGLRMDKVTSGDFTLNYGLVGDDFTATNGTDTQIIDDMCIFYADDNVAVWMDDSSVRMLGKDANDQTIDAVLSDEATITITKSADGVNITDGTVDQTFPVSAWSYVPKSTGAYGFFLNETEVNTGGLDVHYVGSFAGVNCYNSINTYDLPITIDAALTGSELSGARWIKQATETAPEELNPDDLHIIPIDPSIIDPTPDPDVSIMGYNPPAPTYTDGDWGYNLKTIDGVQKAIIVSYTGTGGNIVTPATVGGYDVYQIGLGGDSDYYKLVLNNDNIQAGSTLTITNGPKIIGSYAFYACTNFTGNLTIPPSVEEIGIDAFAQYSGTGFTSLTLSSGLKIIKDSAFSQNYVISGNLTIPNTVTTIENSAFRSCKFVGDLIIPDSVTTIGEYAFSSFNASTPRQSAVLSLPSDITVIKKNAFTDSAFDTIIKWPDNLTTIEESAFSSCKFHQDLTIPDTVTTIGKNAFKSSIGDYLYPINLVLPKSLETIGESAFSSNYMISTLVLDSDVVDIGPYAFSGSQTAPHIVIMSSPTIGSSAFNTFRALTEVANLGGADLNTSVQNWGESVVIKDNIPALGYLAPSQYKETVTEDGPVAALLEAIPLIAIIAVVMMAIGVFIAHRME